MDRRNFVTLFTAIGSAVLLRSHNLLVVVPASARLDKIGIDLATVADRMSLSVERGLAEVAEIGFKEVSFAGYFGRPPRSLRQLLDRNKLASPAARITEDTIRSRWLSTLSLAAEIGHRYLVIDSMERPTLEGFKGTVELLNQAAETAARYKISLLWHHRQWEFQELEGVQPLELLLGQGSRIGIELDLNAAIRAGVDLPASITRWPGSFPILRLSGAAVVAPAAGFPNPASPSPATAPLLALLNHRKEGGIQHVLVADHQSASDPLEAAKADYLYLRELRF